MIFLVELPQGVVIEVRRGGHDALAKLSGDMTRLGISGYIRIERRPKELIPRVSQVVIHDSQPKLAIHESDVVIGGLEALLEIERDSTALDALISLVEIQDDDLIRIINLYPDFTLAAEAQKSEQNKDDWWNYVQLSTSSWRREARLPEQEVIVEAPEYIRQLTKAKLQKFDLGEKHLNYGDTLLNDGEDAEKVFNLAGILASHGRPLLVFSRHDARGLSVSYDIPIASCLKMTSTTSENTVLPNLDDIQDKLSNFLWANKQAIVVFSDLEYLLSINDFSSVINLFRSIIDQVRLGDHLLLVHCNLEVMDDRQRHMFVREFETISTTYLENLILDGESLLDHPICIELSDEELSWIEQQIKFSSNDQVDGADYEVISGGASSIADEDISEAKDKLNQLVDEWQAPAIDSPQPIQSQTSDSKSNELLTNIVEKAFSAAIEVVEEEVQTSDEIIVQSAEKTKPEKPVKKVVAKVKSPRTALRVKRAKRPKVTKSNAFTASESTAAAINRKVELPDINHVTKIKSHRQAIDTDLSQRSVKMDDALKNMLTSSQRKKSREISQALNQNAQKTAHQMPTIKSKNNLQLSPKVSSKSVVYSSSDIASSDASKRRSRESASRTQNKVDIDKNYQKWSTQYRGNTKLDEDISASQFIVEEEQ